MEMGEACRGRLAAVSNWESTKLLVADHRQLTHPPLREALIDLRLADELPVSIISELGRRHLTGFGPGLPIWRGGITFQIGPTSPPPTHQRNPSELFGFRYANPDASRIVQLRRDGATFSVMKGYTTWASAKEAARSLWQQYCQWTRAAEVCRTAVRYINVLTVPVGADFDLYLTVGPRIPPGIPETLSGFLHRVVVPFTPDGTSAIITQALEQKGADGGVVLDIDVWRDSTFHHTAYGYCRPVSQLSTPSGSQLARRL